jgi:hypothetical protein
MQHLQAKPGEVVAVKSLPKCNFCEAAAEYDFATRMGPWAYGCKKHYLANRLHVLLGVGMAQRLIVCAGKRQHDIPTND